MNSVLEAAFQGTPLLCIPLTADQFYNAFAMQWRQTAIVVDKDELVDKHKSHQQKLAYFEGKLKKALKEAEQLVLKGNENQIIERRYAIGLGAITPLWCQKIEQNIKYMEIYLSVFQFQKLYGKSEIPAEPCESEQNISGQNAQTFAMIVRMNIIVLL
jgi:ribosomal protein L20